MRLFMNGVNSVKQDLFCFIPQETLARAFYKAREFIGTLGNLKAAALQLFSRSAIARFIFSIAELVQSASRGPSK